MQTQDALRLRKLAPLLRGLGAKRTNAHAMAWKFPDIRTAQRFHFNAGKLGFNPERDRNIVALVEVKAETISEYEHKAYAQFMKDAAKAVKSIKGMRNVKVIRAAAGLPAIVFEGTDASDFDYEGHISVSQDNNSANQVAVVWNMDHPSRGNRPGSKGYYKKDLDPQEIASIISRILGV